jgi:hypothetical protein
VTDVVYTEDTSSGRVHRRIRDEASGRLLVDERCNLDDAGAFRVLTPAEFEATPVDRRCGHCFPASAADVDVETVAEAGGNA